MNDIVLVIMVIRAFAPNRFRVLKGTVDIPGFANAGSTCLPSAVLALQIVVEHFLSQNTAILQGYFPLLCLYRYAFRQVIGSIAQQRPRYPGIFVLQSHNGNIFMPPGT
jgi:hypothetical protein